MAITHGGNVFGAAAERAIPWQQVIDCSASINPLGPSPRAKEAILAALDRIVHYPSRSGDGLRDALAEKWRLPRELVTVGNGATELLFEWCRRFPSQGAIAAPAFGEFHRAWPNAYLCRLDDPESWPDDRPLVVTRPANPTGHLPSVDAIRQHAEKQPVLVDESFLDFTEEQSLIPFAKGNLYVLHSLTKFWALPGLRAGALVGESKEAPPPWSLNTLAEQAAIASIGDAEHAARTKAFIKSEAAWLAAELHLPAPAANYIYFETPRAAELVAHAKSKLILIRDCTNWPGMPGKPAVRIAVKRRWENEIVLQVIREFLCRA